MVYRECAQSEAHPTRVESRWAEEVQLVVGSSCTCCSAAHLKSTYAAGSKHSIAPPNSFRRVAPGGLLAAAMPHLVFGWSSGLIGFTHPHTAHTVSEHRRKLQLVLQVALKLRFCVHFGLPGVTKPKGDCGMRIQA